MNFEHIKQRWQQVSPREKKNVIIGGSISFLLLLYFLLISPLNNSIQSYEQQNKDNTALLAWMNSAAPEVKKSTSSNTSGKTLTKVTAGDIDKTLQDSHLKPYIKKFSAPKQGTVNISFEKVPFNIFYTWLLKENKTSAITIKKIMIKKHDKGQVDITLTLLL